MWTEAEIGEGLTAHRHEGILLFGRYVLYFDLGVSYVGAYICQTCNTLNIINTIYISTEFIQKKTDRQETV